MKRKFTFETGFPEEFSFSDVQRVLRRMIAEVERDGGCVISVRNESLDPQAVHSRSGNHV